MCPRVSFCVFQNSPSRFELTIITRNCVADLSRTIARSYNRLTSFRSILKLTKPLPQAHSVNRISWTNATTFQIRCPRNQFDCNTRKCNVYKTRAKTTFQTSTRMKHVLHRHVKIQYQCHSDIFNFDVSETHPRQHLQIQCRCGIGFVSLDSRNVLEDKILCVSTFPDRI